MINFFKKIKKTDTEQTIEESVYLGLSARVDMNHHDGEGMAAEVWGPVGQQELDWLHRLQAGSRKKKKKPKKWGQGFKSQGHP